MVFFAPGTYNFLTRSNRLASSTDSYRTAADEFNRALNFATYGKQARLGPLKTPRRLRERDANYCDLVKEQRTFVEGMGRREAEFNAS